MSGLDHIEEHATIGDVDGGTTQLLVERGVVEQIEVLKHQQPNGLMVGIECHLRAQLVKRVAIHAFGVFYQL